MNLRAKSIQGRFRNARSAATILQNNSVASHGSYRVVARIILEAAGPHQLLGKTRSEKQRTCTSVRVVEILAWAVWASGLGTHAVPGEELQHNRTLHVAQTGRLRRNRSLPVSLCCTVGGDQGQLFPRWEGTGRRQRAQRRTIHLRRNVVLMRLVLSGDMPRADAEW